MATHLPAGLSPDAVDVVTELSSIITRLRAAQQPTSTAAAGTTTTTTTTTSASGGAPIPQGVTGTTPLPTSAPTPNTTTTTTNKHTTTTSTTTTGTQPDHEHQELLSVKDLPSATDNLKHKLQRARAAVRTLGDVRRALAQQEAEMRGLEGRRAAQAARLARTQEDGLVFVRGGGEDKSGAGDGEGERMVE
ncbi:RNA polymerase II transcription mediator complex subunit 9-domain-containing protein [Parachaetomium inaequale]|uniref:Mediator of RNA polymerase II transcription subunit 9 n=1 Tax=Parachaetomium inaequale TaxID=2588326 RepID=A0AAN6PGU7_9PEZI|nr:RNA polymerase II transcription mediator complex subunit 9-domain-containing protein [Parachaetomium inaequale]